MEVEVRHDEIANEHHAFIRQVDEHDVVSLSHSLASTRSHSSSTAWVIYWAETASREDAADVRHSIRGGSWV
jgi:hypothetical protein